VDARLHVIGTETDEARYIVVEHITEIFIEHVGQTGDRWAVKVGLPASGPQPRGGVARIFSTHDSKDEARSAASRLAQLIFDLVSPQESHSLSLCR
jgi:hypothetical protein